jgi:hypothetical protein
MTKDHFVAQTYLRHFVDPSHRDMLHAYRKSDGKYFLCNTKDVCHEWDGDQTPLLTNPNLLGDFRKIFEPHWRASVATILSKTLMPPDMFHIAGYFANLMVCTPTWQRLTRQMYNDHATQFAYFAKEMHDRHGSGSELPDEAIAMLKNGQLFIDHDPEFIRATIARQLAQFAWLAYHQDWTIIRNDTENLFLTSDNPVAVLQPADIRLPIIRYLPITPTMCLSICYNRTTVGPFDPRLPPKGAVRWGTATSQGAKIINKLVVQCAEDLVFSSKKSSGIQTLVHKYANFGVDLDFVRVSASESDAEYQGSIIRVRERKGAAPATKQAPDKR